MMLNLRMSQCDPNETQIELWPLYHMIVTYRGREWDEVTLRPVWVTWDEAMWVKARDVDEAERTVRIFAGLESVIVLNIDTALVSDPNDPEWVN
jgi:hypothetical protein